jgi:hypothetical protein
MKEPNNYERWGMAAAIPGLQLAIDQLQAYLDRIRAAVNGLAQMEIAETIPGEAKKRGPKPGSLDHATASERNKSYWAKMTPEERSKEMERRYLVSIGKAPSKAEQPWRRKQAGKRGPARRYRQEDGAKSTKSKSLTPKARKKVGEGQRAAWANYSPAERQRRINAALEGREHAKRVRAAQQAAKTRKANKTEAGPQVVAA